MGCLARFSLAVAAAATALIPSGGAWGADAEHGAALYELRCDVCHSQSVHGRKKRAAADFDEVRQWVERWNENLMLRWSDEDIDDVSVYLNDTYYRYPCPPRICKLITLAPSPPLAGK